MPVYAAGTGHFWVSLLQSGQHSPLVHLFCGIDPAREQTKPVVLP